MQLYGEALSTSKTDPAFTAMRVDGKSQSVAKTGEIFLSALQTC